MDLDTAASAIIDLSDNSMGFKVSLISSKDRGCWVWEPAMCEECVRRHEEGLEMERRSYRGTDLKVGQNLFPFYANGFAGNVSKHGRAYSVRG